MKKFNIMLMGAMALAFAACDEPAPTVPPTQQNPQGPVMENVTMTGTPVGPFADGSLLNLESYVSNPQILVVNLNEMADMPEGGSMLTRFEIASDKDFSDLHVIEMSNDGNQAYVNADEVNAAHKDMFGKNPKERTVYYRVPGYIQLDGTDFKMEGYVTQGSYKEVPFSLGYVVEDAYYFLTSSSATVTLPADAEPYKMAHSDQDVYDDPVFTFQVITTEANTYWMIAPQSAVAGSSMSNAWGLAEAGSTATEGTLIDSKANAGLIPEANKYNVSVNMETKEYTIKFAYPVTLATPGGYNGWNADNSSWMRVSKGEAGHYAEAVMLDGAFKFTDSATGTTWVDDTTWGMGEAGELVHAGGKDVAVPGARGAYWATANVVDLTYTLTPITSVGVVGNLNGWDAGKPIELTPNADGSKWSADVDFDGDGWKIIINHSWDYNYGGSLEEPWFDAGNFPSEAGKYTVSLDLSGNLPVIDVVKK